VVTSEVRLLVVEHGPDVPIARLGDWLRQAGATLDIRGGHRSDEIPDDAAGFDGLVIMGGAMGAHDDDEAPWLAQVRRLLANAVRDRTPTLGVCLGAQLLAAATGGRVERAAHPEIGAGLVAKRAAAATDPLFRELPIAPDVVQWHFDEITALPPSATLLAASPACEVQAFRVGTLAWGVQFHIETTLDIVRRWAESDGAQLPAYDLDHVLNGVASIDHDLVEAWQPFASAFVDVARDPATLAPRDGLPMAGHRVRTAAPITDPAQIRAALAAEMQAARGTHGH